MASKRWKDSREKRDGGAFVAVPLSVLNSVAYMGASPHAKALLWDLCSQLRADNNGDLGIAWKLMQPRGWKSEETLHKAKRELLDRGLIVESRKGARPNKASLFAVTWRDLDYCEGKLDMKPNAFPRGAYRLLDPLPPLKKNSSLTTPTVAEAA